MTDEELISVLVDTEAGLGPTVGYGPTIEAVRALIADRAKVRAAFDILVTYLTAGGLGPASGEYQALVQQALDLADERDRLRVKADGADLELTDFVNLITPLMRGTANALKGEPAPLHMHDWSDLPKVAAALVAERDRLRAIVDAMQDGPTIRRLVETLEASRDHAIAERNQLRAGLDTILDGLVGLDSDDAYVAITMEHMNVVRGMLRGETDDREREQTARERDRLRAVVEAVRVMWDNITAVDADGTSMQFPTVPHYDAIDQGLDALGLLDTSGDMGGRADDPSVSSGADSGEHPRTSRPSTDARRGGTWETAGLIDLADQTLVGDEFSAGGAVRMPGPAAESPGRRGATPGAPSDHPDGMSTRDVVVEYLTRGRVVLREDAQLLIDAAIREETSAGGSSTREGEAAPMMAAPSPPAEGAPGTRPPGAPPMNPSPLTHYQWDPDIGWLAVCRKCGNGPLVGVEEQRGLCGECKVLADLQAHREGEPDG